MFQKALLRVGLEGWFTLQGSSQNWPSVGLGLGRVPLGSCLSQQDPTASLTQFGPKTGQATFSLIPLSCLSQRPECSGPAP